MRRGPFGFTLIELLIVVAIIAILAAIAVPNFLEAQTRADVKALREGGEMIRSKITSPSPFKPKAAEPTVTEIRQADGTSVIQVKAADGNQLASYTIDLARHHYPATSPDDSLVGKIKSWKFGAFLCYNSNQYSGGEFCPSTDPVKDFQPTALDVRQWVRTMKKAGMTYAVLTVRHTSEFLLWDTATSEINTMNSAIKMDLFKAYVAECRKQGIEPGVYYCLWGDGWRANPNARAIILAQLHELATKYGKIPYFWLDMPHCIGWLAKDLSEQELYDSLKNVNPDTVVKFNNIIYSEPSDGSVLTAFPTDMINGELCLPPAKGHDPYRVVDGKRYYIPFEYEPCSQYRGSYIGGKWGDSPGAPGMVWFTYGEGKGFEASKPLPAEYLYENIRRAYARGANSVLLSCAPDHTGQFRQGDIEQLVKLGRMLKNPKLAPPQSLTIGCQASASGIWDNEYTADKAVDDDLTTRWGGAKETRNGWLELDLGSEKTVSRALVDEGGFPRTQRYEIQAKVNGEWKTIAAGTTIGAGKEIGFPAPVKARWFRLNILEANDVPTIIEFHLFKAKK